MLRATALALRELMLRATALALRELMLHATALALRESPASLDSPSSLHALRRFTQKRGTSIFDRSLADKLHGRLTQSVCKFGKKDSVVFETFVAKSGEAISTDKDVVQTPLLKEEGWTRHQERCREATFDGADGVVRPAKSSGLHTFAELTTPSAAFIDASPCRAR